MNNAELAAKLLRETAAFMRDVGAQNPSMQSEMESAAKRCETAADRVEKDPTGEAATSD